MRSTTRHYVSESRSEQLIEELLSLGHQYAPAPTDANSIELFKMTGSLTLVEHVYVVSIEQMIGRLEAEGFEIGEQAMNKRLLEAGFTSAQIEEATEI